MTFHAAASIDQVPSHVFAPKRVASLCRFIKGLICTKNTPTITVVIYKNRNMSKRIPDRAMKNGMY